MAIGYVGLANMAGALAERLQLIHPLRVHDRDEKAMHKLAEKGGRVCGDIRDLAAECQNVFFCLPSSHHVRSAIFESGLSDGQRPGTLLVDETTGDPTATREMAERLTERNVALIDAPVERPAGEAPKQPSRSWLGRRNAPAPPSRLVTVGQMAIQTCASALARALTA
jgi:3-hydroxyisobutyrate dehydrogenase